jgi:hypothetical protein
VYALTLIVVVLGGLFVFDRTTRFAPGTDARVRALTTDPVRVQLDFSPSNDEVTAATLRALEGAIASERRPEVAAELADIAADDDFIASLAAETVERLTTDAAALAFSTSTVDGKGDVVTIVGVTIEMLPRGRGDGINRVHEDGHASINNRIIERCADEIVALEVASSKTGGALVTAINDHIALLEDQAHTQYHLAVSDGILGSHGRAALRAVEVIERAGCVASSRRHSS